MMGKQDGQEYKIVINGKHCSKKTVTAKLNNQETINTEFLDDIHAVITYEENGQALQTTEIFFDSQNKKIDMTVTQETLQPDTSYSST